MRDIAILPKEDRAELFLDVADEMNLRPSVIEKDFWVCWTLDYLFHRSMWKKNLVFKGGTSLSKAYDLISRFSEDIDLILDWRVLGYSINQPWEERSRTEEEKFKKEIEIKTQEFLEKCFLPAIKTEIEAELGTAVQLEADKENIQAVNFAYPKVYSDGYLNEEIKLEIGTLALWTPATFQKISPYSAQRRPNLFKIRETDVLTVTSERTFWEKATILHQEANRLKNSPIPERYSRHYYDMYKMSCSICKSNAFEQKALLDEVAEFKNKFYYRGWARYDEAKIGTLKLMPPAHAIEYLEKDYKKMQNMLFGAEKPTFSEIMDEIEKLEAEINSL